MPAPAAFIPAAMPHQLAEALVHATGPAGSVDAEVEALLSPFLPRTADFLRRLWGLTAYPAPTQTALGLEAGITRERVRQVVTQAETRLTILQPTLPPLRHATAAVEQLVHAGGALRFAQWVDACAAVGVPTTPAALRALPAISDMGWLPRLLLVPTLDLVLLDTQLTAYLATLPTAAALDAEAPRSARVEALLAATHPILVRASRYARRLGAVPMQGLPRVTPLPPAVIASAALGTDAWQEFGGWAVPRQDRGDPPSAVVRETRTILAACGPLDLAAIRRALRRVAPRPIKLPLITLAEILRPSPDFRLEPGCVALTALDGDPATRGERRERLRRAWIRAELRLLLDALEARGGMLTLTEMHAVLSRAGINPSFLMGLRRTPALIKLAGSAYGLTGHPAPPIAREAFGEPTDSGTAPHAQRRRYERNYFGHQWQAETRQALVVYRVTPFTLRGALRLPVGLLPFLRPEGTPWTVRADATTPPLDPAALASAPTVTTTGGVLWDLAAHTAAIGARLGEHLECTFTLETTTITLRRVSAAEAARRETAEAPAVLVDGAPLIRRRVANHDRRPRTPEERAARRAVREARIAARRRERRAAREQLWFALFGRPLDPTATPAPRAALPPTTWTRQTAEGLQTVPADTLDPAHLTCWFVPSWDPHWGAALLITYDDFPMAPTCTGVRLTLQILLEVGRGKPRTRLALLEPRLFTHGRRVSWEEAQLLQPKLRQTLCRHRSAAETRAYRAGASAPGST